MQTRTIFACLRFVPIVMGLGLASSCKTAAKPQNAEVQEVPDATDNAYGVKVEGSVCNVEEERDSDTKALKIVYINCYPKSRHAANRQCTYQWSPSSMTPGMANFSVQEYEQNLRKTLLQTDADDVAVADLSKSAQSFMDQYCTKPFEVLSITSSKVFKDRIKFKGTNACTWKEFSTQNAISAAEIECATGDRKQCFVRWNAVKASGYAEFSFHVSEETSAKRIQYMAFLKQNESVTYAQLQSVAQTWVDQFCVE